MLFTQAASAAAAASSTTGLRRIPIGEQAAIAARFIGSREPPTGAKPIGGKPQSILPGSIGFQMHNIIIYA
jgi:hypothetical protein